MEDIITFDKDRPLNQADIPALMSLMMDRLGIMEFDFTVSELLDVKGKISLERADRVGSSIGDYVMKRVD